MTGSVCIARSSKLPPLIVVETTDNDLPAPKYEILSDGDGPRVSPTTAAKILSTKWHEYSDDAMRTAVSSLAKDAPDDTSSDDPTFAILRVLSSTVLSLTRARQELEESRRALQEKEAAFSDTEEEVIPGLF